MKTGLITSDTYQNHNTGEGHPEKIDRVTAVIENFKKLDNKNLVWKKPSNFEQSILIKTHTKDYIKQVNLSFPQSGLKFLDGDTVVSPGSKDATKDAVGSIISAIDGVEKKEFKNAFCCVRPPGHHAEKEKAMGFCIFNNVAVGANYLIEKYKYKKIAIIDFDVHHGNGTQAAFYEDNSALTISVHQDRNFPTNSGLVSENGEAKGDGFNINIPLPPGSGVGAYEAAFDRVVIPALEAYQPELIIVPSGFDGGAGDPIGRQMMTSEGFKSLTQKIKKCADEVCDGKILMTHEGGYSAATVPFFAHSVIETLADENMGIKDPFQRIIGNLGQQELQPHQDSLIKEVESLIKKIK